MPLSLADTGVELTIRRITGPEKIRKHLNNLGFIEGEPIRIINKIDQSVIVKLKGVSLAITCDLANKIHV